MLGAGVLAGSAGMATVVGGQGQRGSVLPFGIAAPQTTERAALEKDRRADAWTIMQAPLADVEYDSFEISHGESFPRGE